MINHARTLLLNLPPLVGPGSEYVPADFTPVKLSSGLQSIWDTLFGRDTDEKTRLYRARQLVSVLHSTTLDKYVYELDSRVTYWPTTDTDCLGPEPITLTKLSQLVSELENIIPVQFLAGMPQELVDCWFEHLQYAYRLAAVILIFIHKVKELHAVERR